MLGYFPAELRVMPIGISHDMYLSIRRTGDSVYFISEGADKERFDSLSAVHGDTTNYEKILYWYYYFNETDSVPYFLDSRVRLDDDIVAIEFITEDNFDQEHPKGSSINDIISMWFPRYNKSSHTYTLVHMVLNEVTAEDLEYVISLMYLGYEPPGRHCYKWSTGIYMEFDFLTKPEKPGQYYVSYTFRMASGKEYTGGLICPFN